MPGALFGNIFEEEAVGRLSDALGRVTSDALGRVLSDAAGRVLSGALWRLRSGELWRAAVGAGVRTFALESAGGAERRASSFFFGCGRDFFFFTGRPPSLP